MSLGGGRDPRVTSLTPERGPLFGSWPSGWGGSVAGVTKVKDAIAAAPVVGPVAKRAYRVVRRYRFAHSYYAAKLKRMRAWSLANTEETNFYYELTPRNEATLTSLVAAVCGVDVGVVEHYVDEAKSDAALRRHIENFLLADPALADAVPALGRRVGWYAFVRAMKPALVIETGVAHGVGSCVIAAALLRNRSEGYEGTYVGTEIDPLAGQLFVEPYSSVGRIQYGDSIESLKTIGQPVDLFINDSDHSAEYEAREYEVISPKLSPRAVLLGDNSHVTTALRDFAAGSGRPFLFFREEPADHWYPGAGIGISPTTLPVSPP